MKVFGRKPGEGLQEFAKEVAALSHQDKLDLIPGLEAETGTKVAPPEAK